MPVYTGDCKLILCRNRLEMLYKCEPKIILNELRNPIQHSNISLHVYTKEDVTTNHFKQNWTYMLNNKR